jgi:bacterioferritin
MNGNKKVIDSLNARLDEEYGAYNQYSREEAWARARGYFKYADRAKARKDAESEHIQELNARIVFLGGVPVVNRLAGVVDSTLNLGEFLSAADHSEKAAIEGYNETAETAFAAGDHGTFSLALHILEEEEGHKLEAEAMLSQFDAMGEDNWLANQV